jgi:uncharacterized protein YqjF (DUF2071 family)
MGQTWQRLLFAHWRVPHDVLRPHVPESLELEQWDGSAWLGITPFRVAGLRLRGVPPLPLASSFYELNCRTYVRCDDRPGIWFFSLDASSRLAVEAARRTYRLPYRLARFDVDDEFAVRRHGDAARFDARYEGRGPAGPAQRDTLEYFLAERYCLYAGDEGSAPRSITRRGPCRGRTRASSRTASRRCRSTANRSATSPRDKTSSSGAPSGSSHPDRMMRGPSADRRLCACGCGSGSEASSSTSSCC